MIEKIDFEGHIINMELQYSNSLQKQKYYKIGSFIIEENNDEGRAKYFFNKFNKDKRGNEKNDKYKTHAEYFSINDIKKRGIKENKKYILFVTIPPCKKCCKLILKNKNWIKKVVCLIPKHYKNPKIEKLIQEGYIALLNKQWNIERKINVSNVIHDLIKLIIKSWNNDPDVKKIYSNNDIEYDKINMDLIIPSSTRKVLGQNNKSNYKRLQNVPS